jgi:hypothetical protein
LAREEEEEFSGNLSIRTRSGEGSHSQKEDSQKEESFVRLVAQKTLHLRDLDGFIARRGRRIDHKDVAGLVPLAQLL